MSAQETPDPSWLHAAMNDALARRRIVPAEPIAAEKAPIDAAPPAAGFGGGPGVAAPPGENWGDAIRRQTGL